MLWIRLSCIPFLPCASLLPLPLSVPRGGAGKRPARSPLCLLSYILFAFISAISLFCHSSSHSAVLLVYCWLPSGVWTECKRMDFPAAASPFPSLLGALAMGRKALRVQPGGCALSTSEGRLALRCNLSTRAIHHGVRVYGEQRRQEATRGV